MKASRGNNQHFVPIKVAGGFFNLPGHSTPDLKVAVLRQQNLKNQLEQKVAVQEIIHGLDFDKYGLNQDHKFLSRYLD